MATTNGREPVLVCVLPAQGHVSPTLPVVADLVSAGHPTHVITGRRYLPRFAEVGAEVTSLAPDADFDDTDLDSSFPRRRALSGLRLARHDLIEAFVRPLPARWRTVREVLDRFPADTVLVDPLFLAGIPLLATRTGGRPRVAVLGFLPLSLPPLTPPGPWSRVREPATGLAMRLALKPVQDLAGQLTRDLTGQPLRTWFAHWVGASDGILQMTCPGFEYSRPRQGAPIHFVGTPATSTADRFPLPPWWADLDTDRPVIHVTQGTVANADLGAVIEPALTALADRDCLVVVATAGAPAPAVLPANARVWPYLPYDEVLPRCSLMVTNGGYGGVNLALRHGVPLLVVGATEDKRAVAQRVTWSGVGIGLTRPHAHPAEIARAVEQILATDRYRQRAAALSNQMAGCPSVRETLQATLWR